MYELFRNAQSIISKFNNLSLKLVFATQLLVIVIFPLFELFLRQIPNIPIWVFIFIFILHAFLAGYSFWAYASIRHFMRIVEIDKIEQQYENQKREIESKNLELSLYKDEIKSSEKRSIAVSASLSVLHGLINDPINNEHKKEDVEKILAPLIKYRNEALSFTNNEFYNFAVYLYDPSNRQLYPYFRDCDNRIQKTNRSWRVGRGHVGIAFSQNAILISPDITQSNLTGDNQLSTDKEYYASFISIPFVDEINEKDIDPTGVMVITSSKINHLDDQYRVIAECYQQILSLYFSVCKIKKKGTENETT